MRTLVTACRHRRTPAWELNGCSFETEEYGSHADRSRIYHILVAHSDPVPGPSHSHPRPRSRRNRLRTPAACTLSVRPWPLLALCRCSWPALGIRNGAGGVGAPVHHLRQPVCGRGSDVGVFLPSLEAWVPIRAKLAEAARVDLDQRDSGLGRRLLVRFEGHH